MVLLHTPGDDACTVYNVLIAYTTGYSRAPDADGEVVVHIIYSTVYMYIQL
jgi:hypothetical protein